jgi:glucose-6-phosphate isomerase
MLTLDFANCLSTRTGEHGLDPAIFQPGSDAMRNLADLTRALMRTRGTGWERWRLLPFPPLRDEHVRAVSDLAGRLRDRFENLVVLGIGGSALGNIALQSALNPPTWNLLPRPARRGPRLFVIDNVDPAHFGTVLDFCAGEPGGLSSTLFNVISKSGETAETAAQFMIVREMLRRSLGPRFAEHIVAITDPARGTMRTICNRDGYATLPVPEGVGGRFSVLSPVGLFSAAMCGIDIGSLLDGAAAMDQRCSGADLRRNPGALLALILVELGRRAKPLHVLMPYANSLYLLADWYRQLWAESLGKQRARDGREVFTGFTPIKALGTTDQHSQIQLYREGPNDKVIGFVEVEDFGREVPIPAGLGVDSLAYLEGRTMNALLAAEKRATEYALVESRRPNYTIRFPTVDAYHVGEFIQLWQMTTAYAGLMLNIDPYDQPAVETGKQATFGLMGRRGYEEHRTRVDAVLKESEWTV